MSDEKADSPDNRADSLTGSQSELAPPAKRAPRMRLDLLLVDKQLVESRERARRLIMAGEVTVSGAVADKAGQLVAADADVAVRAPLPYVSRGGLKLEAALDAFALQVAGLTAIDVGASTGGFTDCLLQRGAVRVFAVDVGYGQLAWKLRSDPRVVVMERTNIRHLMALPDNALADIAVIDASFIGLALVLPPTLHLLAPDGCMVALVKPQFEAGRGQVGAGGVVRDPAIHRRVIEEVAATATQNGLVVAGIVVSPAPGPAGNVEFLLHLRRNGPAADMEFAIDSALRAAKNLRKHNPKAG